MQYAIKSYHCLWKKLVDHALEKGYHYNNRLATCTNCDGLGTITEGELERQCKRMVKEDGTN